jgi:hypothetical protein
LGYLVTVFNAARFAICKLKKRDLHGVNKYIEIQNKLISIYLKFKQFRSIIYKKKIFFILD